MPFELASVAPRSFERGMIIGNLDILNAAVSLLMRTAPLAARFSGQIRRRSLRRLPAKRPSSSQLDKHGQTTCCLPTPVRGAIPYRERSRRIPPLQSGPIATWQAHGGRLLLTTKKKTPHWSGAS